MQTTLDANTIRSVIETYYAGCNEADAGKMIACFTPDAVHYFPPGMYEGPFRGANKIAERWCQAVAQFGSSWTIDALLIDTDHAAAVVEWTHFKPKQNTRLRGSEIIEFDSKTRLIKEIRAYYASPQARDLTSLELGGFDYAGRGYPMQAAGDD